MDELLDFSCILPDDVPISEFICTRGRGSQFCRNNIPRLPIKAMLLQFPNSKDIHVGEPRGRGRARIPELLIRSEPFREPGISRVEVPDIPDHDVVQPVVKTQKTKPCYTEDFPSLQDSLSINSKSKSEKGSKRKKGSRKMVPLVFTEDGFYKLVDNANNNSDVDSGQDNLASCCSVPSSNQNKPEDSNSGIDEGAVGYDNGAITMVHVQPKTQQREKKKPFDFQEAHQALLAEFPTPPKKINRVSKLTCANLEKFNRQMDKDGSVPSLKSCYENCTDPSIPQWQRYGVITHLDIQRSRAMKSQGKHYGSSNLDRCNNAIDEPDEVNDGVSTPEHDNISTSDRIPLEVDPDIEVNDDNNDDDIGDENDGMNEYREQIKRHEDTDRSTRGGNRGDIKTDSVEARLILELSVFTNTDFSEQATNVTDSNILGDPDDDKGEDIEVTDSDLEKGNEMGTESNVEEENELQDSEKGVVEKVAGEVHETLGDQECVEGISVQDVTENVKEDDVPESVEGSNDDVNDDSVDNDNSSFDSVIVNDGNSDKGNEIWTNDKHEIETSKGEKKISNDKEETCKNRFKKSDVPIESKSDDDGKMWRIHGKRVIQVDGLPVDLNIDDLVAMVNTYGTVADYQQQTGINGPSVRLRLETRDQCEYAIECLDGSDCLFPGSELSLTLVDS